VDIDQQFIYLLLRSYTKYSKKN